MQMNACVVRVTQSVNETWRTKNSTYPYYEGGMSCKPELEIYNLLMGLVESVQSVLWRWICECG